jgi:hypothetical protein
MILITKWDVLTRLSENIFHLRHLFAPYRAPPCYSGGTAEYSFKQMYWLFNLEEIILIIAVKINFETVL